jgi:hypothetical protein
METRVYNGEHFVRTSRWYIAFAVALGLVIALSLWYVNFFGAIILFILAGAYILFSLTKNKHINLAARENWLVIDTRLWGRSTFTGFVVEVDATTHDYHNIIFIRDAKETIIYSFDDLPEKKIAFVEEVKKYLELQEKAPFTSIDMWARRLKM